MSAEVPMVRIARRTSNRAVRPAIVSLRRRDLAARETAAAMQVRHPALHQEAREERWPRSAWWSPSPVWTATTGGPRSLPGRSGTRAWRSSTPACTSRLSRSWRRRIQEDADIIGLSVLSGAHMTLFQKVIELLDERDAKDILVFGGGIIPEDDIPLLEEAGVAKIFTPGTKTQDVVDWVNAAVAGETAGGLTARPGSAAYVGSWADERLRPSRSRNPTPGRGSASAGQRPPRRWCTTSSSTGPRVRERLLHRGVDLVGVGHLDPVQTHGRRDRGQVGVVQHGAELGQPALLLLELDHAEPAVVEHHERRRKVVGHRGERSPSSIVSPPSPQNAIT